MTLRLTAALLLALTVAALARAGDARLEVFDLKHRPADQILPVVQPLLHEGEAVQAHGFQLILRADGQTIDQVRTLLARLDRAPQRLLISVRQSNSQLDRARSAAARIQGSPAHSRAEVRVYATDGREQGATEQQIQVLEGNPAFIEFGQSVPVGERTLVIGAYGAAVEDSVRFRDVTSGFYVRPHVRGTRVVLEISPHRDTLSGAGGGTVNLQRAATTIEGPLGAWIELGGTVERTSADGGGILYRSGDRSEQQGRIAVKVDALP